MRETEISRLLTSRKRDSFLGEIFGFSVKIMPRKEFSSGVLLKMRRWGINKRGRSSIALLRCTNKLANCGSKMTLNAKNASL